jgi:hypothetical protein
LKFIEALEHRAQLVEIDLDPLRATALPGCVADFGNLVEVIADPRQFMQQRGGDVPVALDQDLRGQGCIADILRRSR